jgi:hypothetical protein
VKLTWDRVFAWRMRRHLLDRPAKATSAVSIVERLCGVQAQVASSAELAVAVRQAKPVPGDVAKALRAKDLIKTWAMRGTLHLLTARQAPAWLALMAATKAWEKPVWQRNFVTLKQMTAIADSAWDALDGKVLTREQLTAAIIERTKDAALAEHLASGWGVVLKPLAYQGLLINGPSEGGRVTFTRPDTYVGGWAGLPEPAVAAREAIPAYLGAYGPASADAFNQWVCRGVLKKGDLKRWYAEAADAGEIVAVEVEGEPLYALASELDALAAAKPFDEVRLLPAFDQYVLGPGTKDPHLIGTDRRGEISKAAGWIAAVVVHRGRVAGTWESKDGTIEVSLFRERGPVPAKQIEAEAQRISGAAGRVKITTS